MADHTAALEWAAANPNDPRAKDIQAKAWALSNPDDPRSEQVLAQVHSRAGEPPAGAAPGANPYQIATTQTLEAKQEDEKQSSFKDTMIGLAKKAVGTGAGLIAGTVKGVTLGNVDAPHLLGLDRDPNTDMGSKIGNLRGEVGIGSLLGSALPAAGGALGRIASTATQGAIMGGAQAPSSPEDSRLVNAAKGGAIGGALGTAGEGLQALFSGASRAGNTAAKGFQMTKGDPALQQEARGMLGQASEAFQGMTSRPDLEAKLAAAKIQINPTQFMGHTPEVDQILRNAIAEKSPMGTIPSHIEVSGDTLNKIRRGLDAALPWKQQPYGSLTPAQIKSGSDMVDAANNARANLHSISPEIDQMFKEQANAYSGAAAVDAMQAKPLTALTSGNLDQKAVINSLGKDSGTGLGDYADQLRSAKKFSSKPLRESLQLLKQGAKGASQSLTGSDTGTANDPQGLSAILSLLR